MNRHINSLPRPLGAAIGVILDRRFGEPSTNLHPLVIFGQTMQSVEACAYRDTRRAGLIHTAIGTALGLGAGSVVRSTVLATELSVGGRALLDAANGIDAALASGAIDLARSLLPMLVGRDPSDLDAIEIARATIESVAENTVDAVVAPVLWAACAGAPGALAYRAVNTMDAMVGYRSTRYLRYGWASARFDDALNWVPARLTAGLVALVRPRAARAIQRALATQAPAHPSPNAGVAEAAFAVALGLRLGGTNRYGEELEVRPQLGVGRVASPSDIKRAVRLSLDVSTALASALGIIGAIEWWKNR